jgi:hypothetical protein
MKENLGEERAARKSEKPNAYNNKKMKERDNLKDLRFDGRVTS